MTDSLSSWNDGAAKDAIVGFVDRACAKARPAPFRSRSALRSSTTTAPCGVRSRCRSSSTSSCVGWSRWPRRTRPCATVNPGKPPTSATTAGWQRSIVEHYAGRRHQRARPWRPASWRRSRTSPVDEFEAPSDAFLRSTSHPTLGRGYLDCAYAPMVELLGLPARPTASRTTSPPVGPGLHAADQRRGLRHPERAGDRSGTGARVHAR